MDGLNNKVPKDIINGKRQTINSPDLRPSSAPEAFITELKTPLFCAAPDIDPTKSGPVIQPISPASASIANIEPPPLGNISAHRLITPGHIIPTEKPHRAQPMREITELGTRDVRI